MVKALLTAQSLIKTLYEASLVTALQLVQLYPINTSSEGCPAENESTTFYLNTVGEKTGSGSTLCLVWWPAELRRRSRSRRTHGASEPRRTPGASIAGVGAQPKAQAQEQRHLGI
ncbi:hypothetical protein ColKHC_14335 [Colletotrichum higginsianum]|nr:hypothetical protein ColKHC_14335 [Colletotrichum higginsianum]